MRRSGAPSSPASHLVLTSESIRTSPSKNARKGAAVDQQALPRDIARLRRTEEGAGGAELGRIAEAAGGDPLLARRAHVVDVDAVALRLGADQAVEPVRI